MRIRLTYQLIFVFLLSFVNQVSGQPLDELIKEIRTNSLKIKALDLDYQAALNRGDQVSAYPDLQVTGGIGVLPVETRLGAQIFKLGAMQKLPIRGQRNALKNLEDLRAEVLLHNQDQVYLELEYRLKTAYYNLEYLEEKLLVLHEKLENLKVLESLSLIRIESGRGKLSDLILVQRKIEQIRSDSALVWLERHPFVIQINKILDRPANRDITIIERIPIDQIDTATLNLDVHPDIQLLKSRKEVSDHAIKLNDIMVRPQFAVGVDYAWIANRNDVEIQSNGRDIFMPMASVRIPLSKTQFSAKRNEERLKKESYDMRIRDLESAFQSEIETATSLIQESEQRIIQYESLKKISLDVLELMKDDYATEGRRFEELLRIQLELLDYDLRISGENLRIKAARAQIEKFIEQN